MKRLALIALAALLTSGCAADTLPQPLTAAYLSAQFVQGQYLPGFGGSKPDLGFTLEALAQLSQTKQDMGASTDWAFAPSQTPQTAGLQGKYVFAAHSVDISNDQTRTALAALKADWATSSPTTPELDVFSVAWEVLGLESAGAKSQALNAATVLANLRGKDGGWGGTDATAIALMAFESVGDKSSATGATGWLKAHIRGDHYVAYGSADVNGTEYAIMALHSAGENTDTLRAWLQKQVASDGGISTPWSKGKGDIYATAQGYLALCNRDYVELAK